VPDYPLKALLFKRFFFWHIAPGYSDFRSASMNACPQRHIDGFQVGCEIVSLDAGVLAIVVTVSRTGNGDFQQRWSLPRFVTFADADLVLSGIVSVDAATGEPRYGIL
jgi:hypothetical protein